MLLVQTASAVDLEIGVTAGASYTDNVFLDTSPGEVDDIVYQASPFFNLVHESPRFDANLEYNLDWYRYSDIDRTSKFHSGEASVISRFLQDSLEVELGAIRSQILSDPDDVIPVGNLQLGTALNDLDEWYINPRFDRNLGSSVSLNTQYRYSGARYSDSLIQEDTNHSADFSLENYDAGRGLTWALRYDWQRTEYEVSAPFEYQQVTAELGFWVSRSTRIFAAGGEESNFENPFDPGLEDSFWEAGFAHRAGENLSLELAIGERGFGSSWRGDLDYTFRRGSTTLSYSEGPNTTGFAQDSRRRGTLETDGFDDFLDRPGSAERFIASRLEWALNLEFRRTAFDLSVFDEDREDRVDPDTAVLSDQSQSGIDANLTWRAGVRTTFVGSFSIVDRESSELDDYKLKSAGLSVDYRLGNRTSLSLGYRYDESEPRGQGFGNRDYKSNVISLLFTITN